MARVEWHKQATSVGEGMNVVYGDTDSIFSVHPLQRHVTKSKEELGRWLDVGKGEKFHCLAPKVYTFWRDSSPVVKTKGVRLPRSQALAAAQLRLGVPLKGADGIHGLRKGAREGKFFKAQSVTRVLEGGYGDRIPDGAWTRAPTIDEFRSRK